MQGQSDPHQVLGVPKGASIEIIKAAYRQKAKETHPDTNRNGDREEFTRVVAAYEELRQENVGDGNRQDDDAGAESRRSDYSGEEADCHQPEGDVVRVVRDFMKAHQLEVRFDGQFVATDAAQMAYDLNDVDRVLRQTQNDEASIIDKMVIYVRKVGLKLPQRLIEAGVREFQREEQTKRLATVLKPLLIPLSQKEQAVATEQWYRFAVAAFAMPNILAITILKKFVHQVKSKMTYRPVNRHLMPVFQSVVQGGGKTTAVLKFLSPLKELRTEPALLSDFADKRSADIYRYPVVFIDDMDGISTELVPTLNSLVTSNGLQRRKLGSSASNKIRQCSTLIGTCNKPISDLIPDETGNRRFATMPFRSGETARGGDSGIWNTINEIDYALLWRSVDVFAPDPILDVLPDLLAWQDKFRHIPPVERWLMQVKLDSAGIVGISDHRGTKAGKLYELFVADLGPSISETAFSGELARIIAKGIGPFEQKRRFEAGSYYPHRAAHSPPP